MLHLRVYGPADSLTEIGGDLEARGVARAVALAQGIRDGHVLLTAEVSTGSADAVLELLLRNGVAEDDIRLARLDEIGPIKPGGTAASLIWADMLGQARVNARPVARYLAFMVAAGTIAAFGVIQDNDILIVGAMAVSPDLLPITAACVGLVDRNFRLAYRALVSVAVGMGAACLTAGVLSTIGDLLHLLPRNFAVGESALSGLTTVNTSTILVAFAAGIAGILSLETRASSTVGVAISITTIPAAAYLGVAAGPRGGQGAGCPGRSRRQHRGIGAGRHADAHRPTPARRPPHKLVRGVDMRSDRPVLVMPPAWSGQRSRSRCPTAIRREGGITRSRPGDCSTASQNVKT